MENERRAFLKKSCTLCASLIGIATVAPLLQSCATLFTMKTDIASGSILVMRSNFNADNAIVLIKNASSEFDIAVVDLGLGKFKAFELQCTHQANAVIPTKTGFFCNAHGSRFSLDGKVQKEPALTNLKEYKIEIAEESILVYI